jgi:hypothetical protein
MPQLPSTVDPKTITLSNHPSGGDSKKIGEIARFKISQVGLRQACPCPIVRLLHTWWAVHADAGMPGTETSYSSAINTKMPPQTET